MVTISVILPSHNPRPDYLIRVLAALERQTAPLHQWELLLIDNASQPAITLPSSACSGARVIYEGALGLTKARARGFLESRGELLVLVDDDNVLAPDYLTRAIEIASSFPNLGTWSGTVVPEFEDPACRPPPDLFSYLALRQPDHDWWSNDPRHHASTPWGAGLCVRRVVADAYLRLLARQPDRTRLDLIGKKLVYGGDTDIAYAGCNLGLGKGVFQRLKVTHLIPRQRCQLGYLLSAVEGHAYSEVLHESMTSDIVPNPFRDFVGRLGDRLRRARMSPMERMIIDARERGFRRALLELSDAATPVQPPP